MTRVGGQSDKDPAAVAQADWTRRFFSPLYAEIYRKHLIPTSRTRDEVRFAVAALGLRRKRILDVAAGYGRHARLLARTNDVWALDLSHHFLQLAGESLRRVQADMRALPLRQGSFDAALLLFASFGYFAAPAGQPDPNMAVLTGIARVLRPGGGLLVEVPNLGPVRAAVAREPRRRLELGTHSIEEWFEWDGAARTLRNRTIFTSRAGGREEGGYTLRFYRRRDAEAGLKRAGFSILALSGGYDGAPFDPGASAAMVFVCRKTE